MRGSWQQKTKMETSITCFHCLGKSWKIRKSKPPKSSWARSISEFWMPFYGANSKKKIKIYRNRMRRSRLTLAISSRARRGPKKTINSFSKRSLNACARTAKRGSIRRRGAKNWFRKRLFTKSISCKFAPNRTSRSKLSFYREINPKSSTWFTKRSVTITSSC